MKKNTAIWLSIGGLVLVGGIVFFATRKKPSEQAEAESEVPEYTPPVEMPKIDLTKIFQKADKKKAAEDKYALMKRMKISQSVIDATRKADEQSRFKNVKYPTIMVGGLNLPTTNSNIDSINRLNPTKIGGSFKPSPMSGIGGVK